MSGQPNRYANSAEMFKNQYMDALNLRANVDDFNLQANKNFKATGSLPPSVTRMIDNRTTTEILADTEKLKLNIIAELRPVMTSNTASVVVQKIQTAPANADGSFLIWVAQNIPEIVKSLKRKYAIGIKGDTKDATNIVLYLSDMYSKIKDYSGTVKNYFDTVGESKSGLREGDLDTLRKEYEIIVARLKTKFPSGNKESYLPINDLIVKTTQKIQDLYSVISSTEYKSVIQNLQNVNGHLELGQVNGLNDIAKELFGLWDELPTVSLVRALYEQLRRSIENKNNDLSVKILQEIYDLFPSRAKIDTIKHVFETEGPTNPPAKSLIPPEDYAGVDEKLKMNENTLNRNNAQLLKLLTLKDEHGRYIMLLQAESSPDFTAIRKLKSEIININDAIKRIEEENQAIVDEQEKIISSVEQKVNARLSKNPSTERREIVQPDEDEFVDADADEEEEEFVDVEDEEPVPPLSSLSSKSTPPPDPELENLNNALKYFKYESLVRQNKLKHNKLTQDEEDQIKKELEFIEGRIEDVEDQILEKRASGTGFKKKRRGRPKGSGVGPKKFVDKIDHAKGIQPVKKYHPFGKYFVNSHKLNHGNVLSIKSKSGTNVREYPSRIVSPHLGHVIKTIIGGGVPSWNDMEKLSEDEKDYLYKVSKRAEFADKISIPTPSKDKMEKDIHEFEVCKGEIMAGNDSKELIKKFKLLIIKLSKNGTIPKREASEVMQELLELGY